jgi:hypothetical protein
MSARCVSRALGVAVLASVLGLGCSDTTSARRVDVRTAAPPPGFRAVTGERWAFAVPSEWAELPAEQPVGARARAPAAAGGFATNVNLVVEPFDGDATEYAARSLAAIAEEATVVARRETSTPGVAAIDVEASWTAEVPAFRTVQRYTVAGATGYVLTCAAGEGELAAARAECDRVLETLRVTP